MSPLTPAVYVCSFPLNYVVAVSEKHYEEVHERVGMEPSGQSVASLGLDFQSRLDLPLENEVTALLFDLTTFLIEGVKQEIL